MKHTVQREPQMTKIVSQSSDVEYKHLLTKYASPQVTFVSVNHVGSDNGDNLES